MQLQMFLNERMAEAGMYVQVDGHHQWVIESQNTTLRVHCMQIYRLLSLFRLLLHIPLERLMGEEREYSAHLLNHLKGDITD